MSEAREGSRKVRFLTLIRRTLRPVVSASLTAAMCAAGVVAADSQSDHPRIPPELHAEEARSDLGMVVTGSPEATRVAVEILEKGGNAIDAAVAAALTLGVSDADASGIGGATHLVIHLANGRTFAINGTSLAPMNIDYDRLRDFKRSGKSWGYATVSTPTTLAALEHVCARCGTMDLASLMQPAIDVAEQGFILSKIQLVWMAKYRPKILASQLYMSVLSMEDGKNSGNPGDCLRQPDLANMMRRIVAEGVSSFYRGRIADEIQADMIQNGGFLRKMDLAKVRVREVPPLHTTYRGFDIYTVPPPSGGAALVVALDILENWPGDFLAENSAERHHTMIEAFRIASADTLLTADSQSRPDSDPLRKAHARERSMLITAGKVTPKEAFTQRVNPECETGGESTTQVSVADSHGNVVSLTQTLSRSFGAKVATLGFNFPYNSFLEFFNADKPQCPGYLQPNSPCKNDMAPTIVLRNGSFFGALGSPGSNRIPNIIAGTISNMVDRGMDVRHAVTAPRVLWGGLVSNRVDVEVVDPITQEQVDTLENIGFESINALHYPPARHVFMADFGGVNAIGFDATMGQFTGVGDPRRWGSAMGPRVVPVRE